MTDLFLILSVEKQLGAYINNEMAPLIMPRVTHIKQWQSSP